MVQEEDGVVGTAVEITSVATNCKVPSSVHPKEAIIEPTLQLRLKGRHTFSRWANGQVVEILVGEPIAGRECRLFQDSQHGSGPR